MFMELNKFVKYFLSPTLEVGGSVIIFSNIRRIDMKNVLIAFFFFLAALTVIGCKAKDKQNIETAEEGIDILDIETEEEEIDTLDIKTAEEKIAAEINRMFEESMMDLSISGVVLKKAPENQNAAYLGTVTYISGDSKFDLEILANYDSNLLTWWYPNEPDNKYYIFVNESISQTDDEPIYYMLYESSGPPPETPVQSGGSSRNSQPSNTQSTDTIGKVEQRGSTYTVYNSSGSQTARMSVPNTELVGWGRDFFVTRWRTTFYIYDSRGDEITHTTIGGAETATVESEFFTVKRGNRNYNYDKNGEVYIRR